MPENAQVVGLPGFDSCLGLLRTGHYAAILPDVAIAPLEAKGLLRLSLEGSGIKPRDYFLAWSKRAAANRPPLSKTIEVLRDVLRF